MSRLRFGLVAALAVLGMTSGTAARAQDKVSIIVGGMEKQIYLPAVLAQRLGFFKAEGLDVELINSRAGVEAENELLAGAVQGVVGFYDHTIDLQSKGKSITSVVQLSQAPGEVEMLSARPGDVKTPADLKGKTLGVTGLGSSTDFLTRFIVGRAGLKPGDYTLLPVGAGNTFIAAMKQNEIQAGMTTEPTVSQLLKTGSATVMVDLRTPESTRAALGGLYPAASFYVQSTWLDAHAAQAQKLANALVKTLHWIHGHSAVEIADQMPADYYAGDKALYVRGLADGKAMFTTDGKMPAGGPETVLQVMRSFSKNVQGQSIDLSRTYTTKFVDAAP